MFGSCITLEVLAASPNFVSRSEERHEELFGFLPASNQKEPLSLNGIESLEIQNVVGIGMASVARLAFVLRDRGSFLVQYRAS